MPFLPPTPPRNAYVIYEWYLFDPLTTASELVTESLFDIFEFEAGAFETEAGGEVTRGCSLSEGQLVVSAVVAA